MICLMLAALMFLFATTALAASAPKISKDDFMMKIGRTKIDLLTDGIASIVKASVNKKLIQEDFGYDETEFVLSAKEAEFHIPIDGDYCSCVDLLKKGVTSRGIRIGSKESALLKAYPEPDEKNATGKFTDYCFRMRGAPKELSAAVKKNLNNVRPDYFYDLYFTVNDRTKKVVRILYLSPFCSAGWYE